MPSYEERERELEQLSAWRWMGIAVGHRGTISDLVADITSVRLYPAFTKVCKEADQAAMLATLERTAMALAGYRAKNGHYPESLDTLIPKWLDSVPEDVFANRAP